MSRINTYWIFRCERVAHVDFTYVSGKALRLILILYITIAEANCQIRFCLKIEQTRCRVFCLDVTAPISYLYKRITIFRYAYCEMKPLRGSNYFRSHNQFLAWGSVTTDTWTICKDALDTVLVAEKLQWVLVVKTQMLLEKEHHCEICWVWDY